MRMSAGDGLLRGRLDLVINIAMQHLRGQGWPWLVRRVNLKETRCTVKLGSFAVLQPPEMTST